MRIESVLDRLSETDRAKLRASLEEGYALRNVRPGWFSVFQDRQNWDIAVILDACRFDTFARVSMLPGRLEERISPGSCTEDWIAACLTDRLDDVAYISASPYVSRWYIRQAGIDVSLGHLEEVWRSGWDDALHTVPPRAVLDTWRRLAPKMPGRKFVLHFMQPHHPYIGSVRLAGAGWRQYFGAMEMDSPRLEGKTPPEMLADGEADLPTVLAAYEANLAPVLEAVATISAESRLRMVVTSDHGEAFGECGVYGHPCGLLLPELLRVPYLRLPSGRPHKTD